VGTVSLEAFGVKNLRCLADTGRIPIKPLTILVGRNSSGKSTFLRAFPLLRQSVENARRSPVLWHHKDYVDFGTIEPAINNKATERSVTFEFAAYENGERNNEPVLCELQMEVAPSSSGSSSGPYVRSYELCIGNERVRLVFDEEHQLVHVEAEPAKQIQWRGLWLGEVAYLIASLRGREGGASSINPTSALRWIYFWRSASRRFRQMARRSSSSRRTRP
jgi:hypothetical protein